MNQPIKTPSQVSFLTLLPAITLCSVFALTALQALVTPVPAEFAREQHKQQVGAKSAQSLPMLGKISGFSLTSHRQQPFQASELDGQVWVADFIFTSCQAECPLMSLEMQKLQAKLEPQHPVKWISFTVDPEQDTPQRLAEYAQRYQAGDNWSFLTGSREALYTLAQRDFKLPVQDLRPQGDHQQHQHGHGSSSPFLHSQKFVLVDQKQQIRGYYDSTDPEAMRQLSEQDIPALMAEHP